MQTDERSLPFEAMFNFRDVGGYTGHEGRTVRRRRLYRSDSPHLLGGPDREAFAALGIRTVIDLRRPDEVERDGRIRAYEGLRYRHVHPEHPEWEGNGAYPEQQRWEDGENGLARWLANRYLELARAGQRGLAEVMNVIADADNAPALVHCAAGKDRTGVVCALTLAVLGVTDEDIATDYALSTTASIRLSERIARQWTAPGPPPKPYLACPTQAILLFLDELRQQYGSVEGYFSDAGLPAERLAALRAHLLA